jgi:hypothetical protein
MQKASRRSFLWRRSSWSASVAEGAPSRVSLTPVPVKMRSGMCI